MENPERNGATSVRRPLCGAAPMVDKTVPESHFTIATHSPPPSLQHPSFLALRLCKFPAVVAYPAAFAVFRAFS